MRRTYEKPSIYVENFVMDIEIAAEMTNEQYYALKAAFDALPDAAKDFNQDGVVNEADFGIYLNSLGYDDSTSGGCYFGFPHS